MLIKIKQNESNAFSIYANLKYEKWLKSMIEKEENMGWSK